MQERLIFIRESLNFNQKKMALFLNTSKSNYSRWETGETIIPLKYVITLSNKFHYSLDYILNLTNNKEKRNEKIICNALIIGKNIKEIRKQHYLTQKELGELLFVTRQAISKWECGILLFKLFLCKYNCIYEFLKKFICIYQKLLESLYL